MYALATLYVYISFSQSSFLSHPLMFSSLTSKCNNKARQTFVFITNNLFFFWLNVKRSSLFFSCTERDFQVFIIILSLHTNTHQELYINIHLTEMFGVKLFSGLTTKKKEYPGSRKCGCVVCVSLTLYDVLMNKKDINFSFFVSNRIN